MSDEEPKKHEPFAVLKVADYRLLLLLRTVLTIALQIQIMAVGWQIYQLTKSPLALGLIGLAEVLPAITVALYAGHLADIVDRKTIILSTLFVLALCIGGLSAISLSHFVPTLACALIYTIIAVSGFARGFYPPAAFALVSQMVPRELYGNATAWNSSMSEASAMVGPIIGGVLYVKYGPAATYAVSAALVFIGLLAASFIKSETDMSAPRKAPIFQSIVEGLRFVFSNQIIIGAMALDLFAVLFGGAVALLPIFADSVFHRGPEALGMLRAAPSVGAFISSSVLAFRPINRGAGAFFLAVVGGFGLCMIGFGLSTSFYLSLALLALSGLFDGVSVYLRHTIYQLHTPEDMKGRVAAVSSIFINSSNELGEFESGVMAKLMGTVPSVVFGGCLTLLVVLVTALRAPKLRSLDL